MLNIHNLSVSFGGSYLFEDVTFRLGAGDRVGLVGKNGAGKSTMLKILSRDLQPDSGVIATEKEVRIGFLRQDIDFEQGRTVLEEAYQAFTEIKEVEGKLAKINEQLQTRTDYESDAYAKLIEDLSDYSHRFELLDGYNYVGNTERILLGLGFKRADFNNKTDTFPTLFPVAGVCVSNSQSCCFKTTTFYCSMSLPTTSISKVSSGLRTFLNRTQAL